MRRVLICLLLVTLSFAQRSQQTKPIDTSNIDSTVQPCDNFYLYANGMWLKSNPIPPEFSVWGSFTVLTDKNSAVLKEILEAAAADTKAAHGSNQQKIGDLFATGMDSAAIEKLGYQPILKDLRRIALLSSIQDVKNEISILHGSGIRAVFRFSSAQDEKDSRSMIGSLSQGGLGLPDRDYYLAADDKSKKIREEYKHTIIMMLTLVGDNDAAAKKNAETIISFETKLARGSFTRVELRDPDKNYNKMNRNGLAALTPNFSWTDYFTTVSANAVTDVNVRQIPFFRTVDSLLLQEPVESWKQYLRWKVISESANSLSSPFVAESFRFYGKILTGAKEMQPRWRRILGIVNGTMGEALGELYVAKTFPPDAKEKAKRIVQNLIEAFREHISDRVDWMDSTTRAAALRKLASFTVKIGYPDTWKDYSLLTIDRASYFENVRRAGAFAFAENISEIGKPVDRAKWRMTPQTVNASYNPDKNEIVFPAGILQPPFYNPDADDAVNYGGMGAVIGHELTHGFDDEGSKYDAEGNLKEWWTPETRKRFTERTDRLAAQYDACLAIDSLHVNGKLTNGENIADLGGLSIAFTALQKILAAKPNLTKIDGFTPGQRFFLSWAQMWRRNYRDEALRLQVRTDPHSPGMFRTNVPISNMPEFYHAFDCQSGSESVRAEIDRVRIW